MSLRVLALDYTSALNTHISTIAKNAQKENAERNESTLKLEIVNQYKALQGLDSTLIKTEGVEVIIPIVDITPNKIVLPTQFDSLQNDITPISITLRNIRVNQFNSLLGLCKEKILKYKGTLVSIENLSQPTDYYRIVHKSNIFG